MFPNSPLSFQYQHPNQSSSAVPPKKPSPIRPPEPPRPLIRLANPQPPSLNPAHRTTQPHSSTRPTGSNPHLTSQRISASAAKLSPLVSEREASRATCNKVARKRDCGVQQTVCASCGARNGVVFCDGFGDRGAEGELFGGW